MEEGFEGVIPQLGDLLILPGKGAPILLASSVFLEPLLRELKQQLGGINDWLVGLS